MKYTKYKIGVLTNVTGQSFNDLKKTAKKHGVTFDQIKFPSIPLSDLKDSKLIEKMLSYDIIYYRTGMRGAVIDEVASILKTKGIPCVNSVSSYPFLNSKIRQALIANRHDIPQPKTFYVANFSYDSARKALGKRFVVKPSEGSKGDRVTLVHNESELQELQQIFGKEKCLYQEFIDKADEYRVYTVGSKGIASYKKIRGEEDFRANLHAGGDMQETEPEHVKNLLKFGGQIAKKFDVDIAGIDILVKRDKMLFLEINMQPGWERLDELTGTDFCEETIAYILKKAHKSKPWWRRILP